MTCCSVIGGEKAIVIRVIARDKVTINSNALVIFIFKRYVEVRICTHVTPRGTVFVNFKARRDISSAQMACAQGQPNIKKRFARHRDDMRLANFQRVRGLDAEWKLLRCPTEYHLPNLTPPWANRNLGANRSDVVSGSILKRDVNFAVCFHFCLNDAAGESKPLFL